MTTQEFLEKKTTEELREMFERKFLIDKLLQPDSFTARLSRWAEARREREQQRLIRERRERELYLQRKREYNDWVLRNWRWTILPLIALAFGAVALTFLSR